MQPVASGFESYVRGWRERARQREAALGARARAARAVAERLADVLIRRYGARRVWAIGSLADPRFFHERSDIDLACEGLAPELLADADVELSLAADGFGLDLLPVEEIPSLRERAEREGILLRG